MSTARSKQYRSVLKLKPDDANAYGNLGNALKSKGLDRRRDRSLPDLPYASIPRTAWFITTLRLHLNSKRRSGWRYRGISRSASGCNLTTRMLTTIWASFSTSRAILDGAIQQYREVVRLKPDHVSGRYNLGIALQTKRTGCCDHRISRRHSPPTRSHGSPQQPRHRVAGQRRLGRRHRGVPHHSPIETRSQ